MNIRIKNIRQKTQLSFGFLKDKLKNMQFIAKTKNYIKNNIDRINARTTEDKKRKENNKKLFTKEDVSKILNILKKKVDFLYIRKSLSKISNYKIFNPNLLNKLSEAKDKINILNKDNKINVISKLNNTSATDYNEDFVGIHYSEHQLTITHLYKTSGKTIVKKNIKIEIDTKLIGGTKVENIDEVKNIIEDVIEVFDLKNPPIILLLDSSFFTAKSFSDSQLVVFSEKDPIILSKSPYLPDDTSIQYQRVSGDKLSSYHIVVYAEKNIIESWMGVLVLLDNPVIALSNASINIIDHISNKSTDQIYSILCDIGFSSTTIYIQKKNCGLKSYKLPYGVSLYKSKDEKVKEQLFIRLKDAIVKLDTEGKDTLTDKIYITGNGLDALRLDKNSSSIYGFQIYSHKEYLSSEVVYNIESEELLNNKYVLDSFCLLIEDSIK